MQEEKKLIGYRTYKYKLYQNKKSKQLHEVINNAAKVYNHLIKLQKKYYNIYKKSLHKYTVQKHITKLKNIARKRISYGNNDTKFAILLKLNSTIITNITERIERSYKLFFTNIKKKVVCSPPKLQDINRYRSITLKGGIGFKVLSDNIFKIMKEEYKFFKDRLFTGNIALVHIKRDLLGELYVYVVAKEEIMIKQNKSILSARITYNLDKFIDVENLNDNSIQTYDISEYIKRAMLRMYEARRIYEKKQKNSNNKERALLFYRRSYRKVIRCRNDFYYKLALELVRKYKTIEVIDNSNLLKNINDNNKKLYDNGYNNFISILIWQGVKYDCIVNTTIVK